MQCKKCQHKFSYKFLLRVIWLQLNYEDVECPQCHARYGRRRFSTFIMSVLIALPIVAIKFLMEGVRLKYDFGTVMGVYLLYLAGIIILSPFIVRYKIRKGD